MESVLSRLLRRPEAQEIIGEWVRCIQRKKDPAVFANLYLEIMRDPKNDNLRRDAVAFLMFSDSRDWDEMLADLKPVVAKASLKVLRSPAAELFYVTWKMMVTSQVASYFREELKKAKKKGKTG